MLTVSLYGTGDNRRAIGGFRKEVEDADADVDIAAALHA